MSASPGGHEQLLEATVFARGESRPFGELTLEDVAGRAQELRAAAGWGPTMRVAPVARAWRELTEQMQAASVVTVAGLDPAVLSDLAPRLGVVMPRAPMLREPGGPRPTADG